MKPLSVVRYAAGVFAIGILGLTAALKLGSLALGPAESRLDERNLVIPLLTEAEMILIAALVEIAVIGVFVRARRGVIRFGVVGWLALVFLAYHTIMAAYHRPCSCTGALKSSSFLASPTFTLALLLLLLLSAGIGFSTELYFERMQIRRLPSRPLNDS
jgi:hypothetical protein